MHLQKNEEKKTTDMKTQHLKMLSNESLKQTPVEIAIIIFMYLHIKLKVWRSIGTERRTDRDKEKGKQVKRGQSQRELAIENPLVSRILCVCVRVGFGTAHGLLS